MQGCPSTRKTLLYGSGRIFQQKHLKKTNQTKETTASNVTVVTNKAEESPGMPSVTNVKGLFQINEVNFQSSFHTERVLILCDFACSNLRIFWKTGWKTECPRYTFETYSSRNYLTWNHWHANCRVEVETSSFEWLLPDFCSQTVCEERHKRWNRSIWCPIITSPIFALRADSSKEVRLRRDVEMIFGQDLLHCKRSLEYFETDPKNTPIAVRLTFGWVLSGPLPSASGLFFTCFKAVTQIESDFNLADQIRNWYELEPFRAYK